MALIKCKHCDKTISDKAKVCPHCGGSLLEETLIVPEVKCKEYGCEKDIGTNTCLNCGYNQGIPSNLAQKKKFGTLEKVAVMVVLAISLAVVIMFQLVQKSGFSLNQTQTTFELGEKVELVKCVQYDEEKLRSVNVVDNGGFDSEECGIYTVVYSVENKYGKTKEIPLTFEVKDTTIPKIALKEEKLRVIRGKEIDLKGYVEVEDNSENCEINITGDYDFSKKGEYTLKVSVTDKSGNTSDEMILTLSVEDRDNCDIRNAKFGDNMETVIDYEESDFINKDNDAIFYEVTLEGMDTYLYYYFNENDQLYQAIYSIQEDYINYNTYIEKMGHLLDKLIEKYGNYDIDRGYKGGLYNYCGDKGRALQLGQLGYRYRWVLEDMEITLILNVEDDLAFLLGYSSSIYEAPEDDSNNI